jgi:hypothetical protein
MERQEPTVLQVQPVLTVTQDPLELRVLQVQPEPMALQGLKGIRGPLAL